MKLKRFLYQPQPLLAWSVRLTILFLPPSPPRYEVKITPDLEKFTYEGEEKVEISVIEATSTVVVSGISSLARRCDALASRNLCFSPT